MANRVYIYFQITAMVGTLTELEKTYDKNVVLATRREYINVQLQLEECERRHQELFNPNIGKLIQTKLVLHPLWTHFNNFSSLSMQGLVHTQVSSRSASPL